MSTVCYAMRRVEWDLHLQAPACLLILRNQTQELLPASRILPRTCEAHQGFTSYDPTERLLLAHNV